MVSQSIFSSLALALTVRAVTFTVQSTNGNATSPYQYGLMFEDINNSGDGGVYAELIQNRAFQGSPIYPSNLSAWYPIGGVNLALSNLSDPLSSALPTSVRVSGGNADEIGFWNEGECAYYPVRICLTMYRFLGFPCFLVMALQWLVLHPRRVQ